VSFQNLNSSGLWGWGDEAGMGGASQAVAKAPLPGIVLVQGRKSGSD
jgi:hypothetical protein